MWVASDMAIDFRFSLLTGEDAEIATAMQGQPKGLQGKGKVWMAGSGQVHQDCMVSCSEKTHIKQLTVSAFDFYLILRSVALSPFFPG